MMLLEAYVFSKRFRGLVMVAMWGAFLVPSSFAGVWSSALSEARSVRRKTEDVAQRLNEKFPFSVACQAALQMDNAACQLVESISCGAPWHQVQASLQRTCQLANQVNALVNADCNVRNDRRTRDYLNDLSKRLERLRCSLDKAFAKTQPVFCDPPRPKHSVPGILHRIQVQTQRPFIPHSGLGNSMNSFPRNTYDFDLHPDGSPFEVVEPIGFPNDHEIGPIGYQVNRNPLPRSTRGQMIAKKGLEVLLQSLAPTGR